MPDLVLTLFDRPAEFSPENFPNGSQTLNFKEGVILGRDNNPNSVYLNSSGVSRTHAQLICDNSEGKQVLKIKNISHKKKIYITEKYQKKKEFELSHSGERVLKDQSTIKLGGFRLKLRINWTFPTCDPEKVVVQFGNTIEFDNGERFVGSTEESNSEMENRMLQVGAGINLPNIPEHREPYSQLEAIGAAEQVPIQETDY